MTIRRKRALERMESLVPQIEAHLKKMGKEPASQAAFHWKCEVRGWINQMENALPNVGIKTKTEWLSRIEEWKRRLGE